MPIFGRSSRLSEDLYGPHWARSHTRLAYWDPSFRRHLSCTRRLLRGILNQQHHDDQTSQFPDSVFCRLFDSFFCLTDPWAMDCANAVGRLISLLRGHERTNGRILNMLYGPFFGCVLQTMHLASCLRTEKGTFVGERNNIYVDPSFPAWKEGSTYMLCLHSGWTAFWKWKWRINTKTSTAICLQILIFGIFLKR